MRVRRQPDIATVIRLGQTVSLDQLAHDYDDGEPMSFHDFLAAPEPHEDPNAIVHSDTFNRLDPGVEPAVLLFRADGYDLHTISHILGMTEAAVKQTSLAARAPAAPTLASALLRLPLLVQAGPPDGLQLRRGAHRQTALRQGRPGDALERLPGRAGHSRLPLLHPGVAGRTNWLPFGRADVDWLGESRVIGNRCEQPKLFIPQQAGAR